MVWFDIGDRNLYTPIFLYFSQFGHKYDKLAIGITFFPALVA